MGKGLRLLFFILKFCIYLRGRKSSYPLDSLLKCPQQAVLGKGQLRARDSLQVQQAGSRNPIKQVCTVVPQDLSPKETGVKSRSQALRIGPPMCGMGFSITRPNPSSEACFSRRAGRAGLRTSTPQQQSHFSIL